MRLRMVGQYGAPIGWNVRIHVLEVDADHGIAGMNDLWRSAIDVKRIVADLLDVIC